MKASTPFLIGSTGCIVVAILLTFLEPRSFFVYAVDALLLLTVWILAFLADRKSVA